MRTIDDTSLTPLERRTLERYVALLEEEFGERLRAVWLFGSRARGEEPGPESDVDVLVVAERRDLEDDLRIILLLDEAAAAAGATPYAFSPKLYEPERVVQRRQIESFFMQEVDRDKIVLAGEP